MNSIKEAYIYGLKDGVSIGIEKGIELAEQWMDCPNTNTTMTVVETIPYNEPAPQPTE